ncbi:hypothetical protein [Plastoroseomonas arctica]|uniref:Uncharacterized protein n=1 Tax=Plastoroseomonas arctica TaxID=1509237 RepID=A0AAF1JWH5_9PROT|nr:hypothetical protein [Plastoroseomonas arctica]MBR0654737.1 hypothetical protein [Plastoroseomonas arctica]
MAMRTILIALLLCATPALAQNLAFDGNWRGTITPSASARGNCASGERTITVRRGVAEMSQRDGEAASGTIATDGNVTMTGGRDGRVTITGRFQGNAFTGEYRTRGCVSSLTLGR